MGRAAPSPRMSFSLSASSPVTAPRSPTVESTVALFHAFSASASALFPGLLRGNVDRSTSHVGLPTPDPLTCPVTPNVTYPPRSASAPASARSLAKYPAQASLRVGHASHRPAPAPGHASTTSLRSSQRPGPTSATALRSSPSRAALRSTTGTTKILLCSSLLRNGVAAARSLATLSASPYTTATLAACLRLSSGNTRSFLNLSRWITCMPPSASSRCRRSRACLLCFTSTAVNPAEMAKKSRFWSSTTTPSSSPRKSPPMDWGRLPARPSAVQPTRMTRGKKKALEDSQMASTSGR
mmetsp:Transcript_4797/g.17963  ORF Transcript_4797/g.17963 Transcript_4797/m.17963 type:complete len:297 (+) Transcript_4797:539-1429(+)